MEIGVGIFGNEVSLFICFSLFTYRRLAVCAMKKLFSGVSQDFLVALQEA